MARRTPTVPYLSSFNYLSLSLRSVPVVCVKFCKSDPGAWKFFFTQVVILTTANGAGETALLRRSTLAGPVVNNASALFRSLEITPHFFLMRGVTP